jgi:hypothetical protein
MRNSKALILTKTGTKVASPENTLMIVLNSLSLKIVDKATLELTKDQLWSKLAEY